jgi:anti-anti-sigma factor
MAQAATLDEGFIAITRASGAVIVRVGCAKVREQQAVILRQTLMEAARLHGWRVAVGLEEVEEISSACIGDMLVARKQCEAMDGGLVLFGVNAKLAAALRPTGLLKSFAIARDHTKAVEMLKERRAEAPSILGRIGLGKKRGAA